MTGPHWTAAVRRRRGGGAERRETVGARQRWAARESEGGKAERQEQSLSGDRLSSLCRTLQDPPAALLDDVVPVGLHRAAGVHELLGRGLQRRGATPASEPGAAGARRCEKRVVAGGSERRAHLLEARELGLLLPQAAPPRRRRRLAADLSR